eukprot:8927328-Pyramimonas_sp.AAC.1
MVPHLREVHALAHAPRCAVFRALLRPAEHAPTPSIVPAALDDTAAATLALAALRKVTNNKRAQVAAPALCAALHARLNGSQLTAVAAAVG